MATADVGTSERRIGVRVGGPVTRSAPWQIADQPPVTGWLTDAMRLPAGHPVPPLASMRAVPHIAVVLGRPLAGPGVSPADALAAVASVHAAAELAGADEIADNASARRFLASPAGRPAAALDLALEACLVEVGGQVVDSGTGAAAAGHPAEALAWAANALAAQGQALEPGWLVLTGALTAPVPLPAGVPLAVHFTTLGSLFLPSERAAG
jgi:2-oxo-3-hexenedioate decarboxylase